MRKGEATRQAVLERAAELARTDGLEGLTIGGLSHALGLSKSGLFAHFGSKEALQLEVIEEAKRQFVAEVVSPALAKPRGEPRLRALFERWMVWGSKEGGCPFVAFSVELDDREGPVRDALAGAQRDWLDTLGEAVRIAIAEGHLAKRLDVGQFTFELYGMMLSCHMQHRMLRDPKAAERARRGLEGLLARSRP